MFKLLIVALGATALSTGAFATEAFIGQVGNANSGHNIQLNQTNNSNSNAIIYQEQTSPGSNGHDALQVQLTDDNYAYTFQKSNYFDHIALTWQDGGTNNSAVTVQWTDGDTGCNEKFTPGCSSQTDGDYRLKSRIIQHGANNVAVNWQSSGGGYPTYNLNPASPALSVGGGSYNVSGPGTTVNANSSFNGLGSVPFSF
jgi:hypothetical protein